MQGINCKKEETRSINIGEEKSKLTIYKDEQGRYKTYIKGRELQEDGTEKDIFMQKQVQFRKDTNLQNKTVIEVIKGWNSCYRVKTDELNEKRKYKYYDKYFVSEFKILKEGEKGYLKTKQEKQKEDFSFSSGSDFLPFQEANMNYRETIRKGIKTFKDKEIFLYGRIRERHKAVAYCTLHKCYLEPRDITEKQCNKKRCKYIEEV